MTRDIRRSFAASIFGLLSLTMLSVPSRAAADIGDFNGDGHQDLVWMGSSTLQVTVNYYNNSSYLGWNWLNKTGGTTGWVVVAAADFDGNGIPDLVWQNTSTQQVIIQYYGGTGGANNIGSYTLYTGPEPGWSVVAAGGLRRQWRPRFGMAKRYHG